MKGKLAFITRAWMRDQISAGGRAWVALWNHREPATSLAMVRIFVGLVVLADLLMAWHLGLVEAIWATPPDGFANTDLHRAPWMIRHFGPGADTARLTWTLAVVASLAVITGTFTRVACVGLVLLSAQLSYLAPDGDRGIDKLLRVVLLVIALSSSHARWSIDSLFWRLVRRPMGGSTGLVPAWPRYLLFAQLGWMYFVAGAAKIGAGWNPFYGGLGALGRILSDPHMSKVPADWVPTLAPILVGATIGTLLFELCSPLWMLVTYWNHTRAQPGRLRRWSNRLRLRWLFLLTGIMMHLGIALTMRLGIFPWGCLAIYPVVISPAEWSALWRWIRRKQPPANVSPAGVVVDLVPALPEVVREVVAPAEPPASA